MVCRLFARWAEPFQYYLQPRLGPLWTIGEVVYTLVFDYENRLTEVKQGTTVLASFVYDADGNRVKSTVGGVTTVYIAGLYEYSGGAARSYYTGPGGVVAMRSGGVVYYLLSDQLNSTARIVNSAGVIQADTYYYPYGSKRSGSYSSLTTKCCSDAAAIRVGRRVVSS
ncbi:MAG: hypothetical protein D6694_15790, partial [Gammaproteobacteria bacterium]